MWDGTVVSIHIAREAAATMQSITDVRAFPGRGLEGDRYFAGTGYYSKTSSHGGREVTLIEIETIEVPHPPSLPCLHKVGVKFDILLSSAATAASNLLLGVK